LVRLQSHHCSSLPLMLQGALRELASTVKQMAVPTASAAVESRAHGGCSSLRQALQRWGIPEVEAEVAAAIQETEEHPEGQQRTLRAAVPPQEGSPDAAHCATAQAEACESGSLQRPGEGESPRASKSQAFGRSSCADSAGDCKDAAKEQMHRDERSAEIERLLCNGSLPLHAEGALLKELQQLRQKLREEGSSNPSRSMSRGETRAPAEPCGSRRG
jgi:hypothetical protein